MPVEKSVPIDIGEASLTGVRGKGAKQELALYNADMQAMFREVTRVLKVVCAGRIRDR